MAKKLFFIAIFAVLAVMTAKAQVIVGVKYVSGDRHAYLDNGQIVNIDAIQGINANDIKIGLTIDEAVAYARQCEARRLYERRREAEAQILAEQLSAYGYGAVYGGYPMGAGYPMGGVYGGSTVGGSITIGGVTVGGSTSTYGGQRRVSGGVNVNSGNVHVNVGGTTTTRRQTQQYSQAQQPQQSQAQQPRQSSQREMSIQELMAL